MSDKTLILKFLVDISALWATCTRNLGSSVLVTGRSFLLLEASIGSAVAQHSYSGLCVSPHSTFRLFSHPLIKSVFTNTSYSFFDKGDHVYIGCWGLGHLAYGWSLGGFPIIPAHSHRAWSFRPWNQYCTRRRPYGRRGTSPCPYHAISWFGSHWNNEWARRMELLRCLSSQFHFGQCVKSEQKLL